VDARVYGTRLVWNSVMSTFRAPSKRMEAVRDEMGHEAVQVGVRGAVNVKGAPADVVDRLVVEHDRDVRVLQQGVKCVDSTRLYCSTTAVETCEGDEGARVGGEGQRQAGEGRARGGAARRARGGGGSARARRGEGRA